MRIKHILTAAALFITASFCASAFNFDFSKLETASDVFNKAINDDTVQGLVSKAAGKEAGAALKKASGSAQGCTTPFALKSDVPSRTLENCFGKTEIRNNSSFIEVFVQNHCDDPKYKKQCDKVYEVRKDLFDDSYKTAQQEAEEAALAKKAKNKGSKKEAKKEPKKKSQKAAPKASKKHAPVMEPKEQAPNCSVKEANKKTLAPAILKHCFTTVKQINKVPEFAIAFANMHCTVENGKYSKQCDKVQAAMPDLFEPAEEDGDADYADDIDADADYSDDTDADADYSDDTDADDDYSEDDE